MSAEALPKIGKYIENEEQFVHVDAIWLANLIDTVNNAFYIINARLVALGG